MDDNQVCFSAHPQGEPETCDADRELIEQGKAVETFGGKIFVRWDAGAAVTAFAPVAYFLEFLKANGLWQQWVEDCPLRYDSPNAPPKADILGTILLSVLRTASKPGSHWRERKAGRMVATFRRSAPFKDPTFSGGAPQSGK